MRRVLPPLIAVALAAAWISSDLKGPSSPPDQLQIHEYGRILGFPESDMTLRRVIRPVGPFFAQARP